MGINKVTTVDFSDIFAYAEKEFGIGWNAASDVFFNNALTYQSYDDFKIGGALGYTDVYADKKNSWEYSREEILEMSEHDQSYMIIDHFMHDNDLQSMTVLNS